MSASKGLDESLPHGMGYHQTSTQPILRYLPDEKIAKEDDDSDESSSSHDENLFVEFDSSDDEKEYNQQ